MISEIIENKQINKGYFHLRLCCPEVAEKALPGQFIMMQTNDGYDPLLKRPMSIYKVLPMKGIVEVIYQIVGRGTKMLSERGTSPIDILGPLGNSFSIDKKKKNCILVAGGVGIAPFMFLIEEIKKINKDISVLLLAGGKNEDDILMKKEFEKHGADIYVATEDGSMGSKGLVTELMQKYIPKNSKESIVYSCGPYGMMEKVAEISDKYAIDCHVSLDERMACGIGVCMGCVVSVKDHVSGETYQCACKKGPVFNAKDIVWQTNF